MVGISRLVDLGTSRWVIYLKGVNEIQGFFSFNFLFDMKSVQRNLRL